MTYHDSSKPCLEYVDGKSFKQTCVPSLGVETVLKMCAGFLHRGEVCCDVFYEIHVFSDMWQFEIFKNCQYKS